MRRGQVSVRPHGPASGATEQMRRTFASYAASMKVMSRRAWSRSFIVNCGTSTLCEKSCQHKTSGARFRNAQKDGPERLCDLDVVRGAERLATELVERESRRFVADGQRDADRSAPDCDLAVVDLWTPFVRLSVPELVDF